MPWLTRPVRPATRALRTPLQSVALLGTLSRKCLMFTGHEICSRDHLSRSSSLRVKSVGVVNHRSPLFNFVKAYGTGTSGGSGVRNDFIHHDATIFALSTANGRAAIAIVRCSGPACLQIHGSLCPGKPSPKPRQATVRKLFSPDNPSSILDPGALLLYFPGPSTVTGEDVLELHLHGGRATVRAVLSAISSLSTPGLPIRPAEAGEFTQRAFYNGRMDLTQVESLGDTLAAETEAQRILAANGAGGSNVLRDRYRDWREQLLQARGELEALIDFSEDQHFDESPIQLAKGVAVKVRVLLEQINASIQNAARGELLRAGIKVALLGAPNVGKSSLLNRIVGREAAIVSSTAGTTRDVVETNVDIGGFFCNFGDLAGIRGPTYGSANEIDHIEQEGIRRARARALAADVVLVVRDIVQLPDGSHEVRSSRDVDDAVRTLDRDRQKILYVINKADLLSAPSAPANTEQQSELLATLVRNVSGLSVPPEAKPPPIHLVSCNPKPGASGMDGIQELLTALIQQLRNLTEAVTIPGVAPSQSGYEESLGASERQARLLERCRDHLREYLEAIDVDEAAGSEDDIDIVVAAESLREAARCFAKMTGEGAAGDVEDVLGVVFEKFCVGK